MSDLTDEQLEKVREAVIDMSIAGDPAQDREAELLADRVVFWLRSKELILNGDDL